MPPKEPDKRAKPSRTIRRLVIWYRRNAAVTSLVGTATSAASTAGSVAGAATNAATSAANTVLQPLVFDPLRRLQRGLGGPDEDAPINDADRLWVAVDGMGGDHAPGPILEGCLQAVERLPLRVRFVAEIERLMPAIAELGLQSQLDVAIARGLIQLVPSGPSVGMDEEATVVRKKRDASINLAMDLVKRGQATAVYSAGNSGAVMASAIFRLGRLKGVDRPAIGALFPTRDPEQQVLVLDVGANMDCKPEWLHQWALVGNIYSRDVLQVGRPRIGLVNIGEEECKGNDLCLRTHPLLAGDDRFVFAGNSKAATSSPATSTWWSATASPAMCCSSSLNRWAASCWTCCGPSCPGGAGARWARRSCAATWCGSRSASTMPSTAAPCCSGSTGSA